MENPRALVSEIQKQLSGMREKLLENRDEKKQLLKLSKALNTSLRMMGEGEAPKKKTKVRRRTSRKHSAPATASA